MLTKKTKTYILNILYVDDDAEDQELFCEAILALSTELSCACASSCEEALSLLHSTAVLPEYIFLDINMPNMDGKSCCKELKRHEHLRHIPVIFYSTTSNKKEIDECISLGARFIPKPNSIAALRLSLEGVIRPLLGVPRV
jgi:CheY-like chemotaxis protein